jgi:RNA polymerase sigma factor (sigma-70 family)
VGFHGQEALAISRIGYESDLAQRGLGDGQASSPEQAVLDSEEHEQLARAIGRISDRSRALLALRECWELSYHEIAEAMGMSLPSVKKYLHLARAELRSAYLMETAFKEGRP